jgi:tRNA(fMet)-specific endonuclease VapC
MTLDEPADRHYAKLRWHPEQRGSPVGPNDLFITANALVLDCTLVTANDRDFSRVPGLKVVNWLSG